MGTWPALAIPCSPLLGEKRAIMGTWQGCSLWPFPSACQAKGYFTAPTEGPGNLRRECSRWPFPLPVDEKAISSLPRRALGLLGGSARDGLSPLPIEENAISGLPQKRPGGPPGCLGRSRPKTTMIVNKCTMRLLLFWTGSNTCISAPGPGMPPEAFRGPRNPSEGPGNLRWECSRWPLPSARRGKGNCKVPSEGSENHRWECSRWPFPPAR